MMEFKSVENLGREFRDVVLRLLRDYSEALVLAVIMAIVLRTFVFASYKISNMNMEPSLKIGDFIIGYRLPYGFYVPFTGTHLGPKQVKRGEVIVFRCPKQTDVNCVKRVVALPGDNVSIKGQRLYINGKVAKYTPLNKAGSLTLNGTMKVTILEESIRNERHPILISDVATSVPDFGPYIVPPDSFFALGDNRDFSEDSRHWGAVSMSRIESRAFFIWLSIEWFELPNGQFDSRVRWERIFSWVR